jgi:hypothetical protein
LVFEGFLKVGPAVAMIPNLHFGGQQGSWLRVVLRFANL